MQQENFQHFANTTLPKISGSKIQFKLDTDHNELDFRKFSEWKSMLNTINNRPKKWIKRFADQLNESNIRPDEVDEMQEKWNRMTGAGWENIVIHKLDPPNASFTPLQMNDVITRRKDIYSNRIYCSYCWDSLGIGSQRVHCEVCGILVHRDCIKNIKNYIEIEVDGVRLPPVNTRKSLSFISGCSGTSANGTTDFESFFQGHKHPSVRTICWTCPLCEDEIIHYNASKTKKVNQTQLAYKQLLAAIRLQAFVRMVIQRNHYEVIKYAVVTIQRVVRAIQFARAHELQRSHQRRPFRVRIHAIHTFFSNTPESPSSSSDISILMDSPSVIKIGEMKASLYDQHVSHGNMSASPLHATDTFSPCNAAYSNSTSTSSTVSSSASSMLDYLRPGHTFQPTYLQSFRALTNFEKGDFFLIITLHDNEGYEHDNQSRKPQIYRFDAPVTRKIEKLTVHHLEHLGIPRMSNKEFDHFSRRYSYAKYTLSKPYILFPSCKPNVEMRLTLAQVTDWPKVQSVGQMISETLNHQILWKVNSTCHQRLHPTNWSSFPVPDDGCKISLIWKSKKNSTGVNATSNAGTSVSSGTSGGGSGVSNNILLPNLNTSKIAAERVVPYTPTASFITWSLLTYCDTEENHAGFLDLLNQPDPFSTKRRCWIILQDRYILAYNKAIAVNTFLTIDLSTAVVTGMKEGLIRIRYGNSTEVLYLMATSLLESVKWFRKLYSQSISVKERSYLDVIKRMVKATHAKVCPQNFSFYFDDKMKLLFADAIEDAIGEDNKDSTAAGGGLSISIAGDISSRGDHVPLLKSPTSHSFKASSPVVAGAGVACPMTPKTPNTSRDGNLLNADTVQRKHKKEKKATVNMMNALMTATKYTNKVSGDTNSGASSHRRTTNI